MALVPISAMPAATQMNDADVFPIVQSGGNLKCDRRTLLTAPAGEGIKLAAGGARVDVMPSGGIDIGLPNLRSFVVSGTGSGFVEINNLGGLHVGLDSSASFEVTNPAGVDFLIDGSGSIVFACAPAAQIFMTTGSGTETMNMVDGGGIQFTVAAGQVVFIPYLAANPGQWKVAPPADINTAIDRIANTWFTNFGLIL